MLSSQDYRPRHADDSRNHIAQLYAADFDSSSLLSQYQELDPVALSILDLENSSEVDIPRRSDAGDLLLGVSPPTPTLDQLSLSQSQIPDLMQSDPWASIPFPTSKTLGRIAHHRESSLSSLGSAGPASPYSTNTSNPQIAVTDSSSDGFADLHSEGYYQLASKSMTPTDSTFSAYAPFGADAQMGMAPFASSAAMVHQQPKQDRSLLPAPDFGSVASRSHPTSVASSVAGDSPATPLMGEPEDDRRRKPNFAVPKLDRTMTDAYTDELYNPNSYHASASSPRTQVSVSPSSELFSQRLQAANSQHLNAASISRGRSSPFRQGSPLAPAPAHDFAQGAPLSAVRYNNAQQMREQLKAENDAQALKRQLARRQETETPKTISPKDAMLEFPETDNADFPLFPTQDASTFGQFDQLAKAAMPVSASSVYHGSALPPVGANSVYVGQRMQNDFRVPQHYPFIPQAQPVLETATNLASAVSGPVEGTLAKPIGASADGGTYTCTYHGCTQRFETPALLQKHKREGHRQAQGIAGLRRTEPAVGGDPIFNSQAGPHKCDRINPSTGKPCNTIFSRPYDLTRHEDTIHNARKQKVRCNLCTEEKTFSRADALTRHFRVCHPDVGFPGKSRRRNAQWPAGARQSS